MRRTVARMPSTFIAGAIVLAILASVGQGKSFGEEKITFQFKGPKPTEKDYMGIYVDYVDASGADIHEWFKPESTTNPPYSVSLTYEKGITKCKFSIRRVVANGFGYRDTEYQAFSPIAGSHITIEYEFKEDKWPKITSVIQTSIKFDKTDEEEEVRESKPIRAAKDSPQVKREEHTVKYSVGIQEGYKVEGELKLNLAVVEASIKGGIERSTNKTYEESKTSFREVTIPGNGKPYKMVWIETYRTGKAITIVNGKEYEVPFKFRNGWDLRTKPVEE